MDTNTGDNHDTTEAQWHDKCLKSGMQGHNYMILCLFIYNTHQNPVVIRMCSIIIKNKHNKISMVYMYIF